MTNKISTHLPKKYRQKVEQLYSDHKRLMFYVAMQIVKNADHAEDIVHSSFLRIIRHIEKIDSLSAKEKRGYISFIVRNLAIDFIRHHDNSKTVPLEEFEDYLSRDLNETEAKALINLEIEKITECLKELGPKYSFAVFHRYVLDYSMAEIADMLDITIDNAKVRCHRGRLKLVDMMLAGDANG